MFGTKQAQGKMSSSNQSTNKPEQYPTNTKKQGASSLRRMVLSIQILVSINVISVQFVNMKLMIRKIY